MQCFILNLLKLPRKPSEQHNRRQSSRPSGLRSELVEYLKEQKKIHQDKAVERSGKKVQKKSQRLGPASVFDPLLAKSRCSCYSTHCASDTAECVSKCGGDEFGSSGGAFVLIGVVGHDVLIGVNIDENKRNRQELYWSVRPMTSWGDIVARFQDYNIDRLLTYRAEKMRMPSKEEPHIQQASFPEKRLLPLPLP
ncbi:hypothetical protein PCH_Pc16g09760 [Penicillium rubens Wisconsin 54-1255]|uniref:Uncharacterized protein n=1 Tax=Penicillium rubens (strain ATCC 28089 / DSM 1075 / NRRL 1951 / Wisconsin 54-1255) TaxID=500485 RepID=B6H8V9_PENRW|nr:hypothetical protein PCH_Pc16g09760 [Penicillium rubens Wisconsin 54-1255]